MIDSVTVTPDGQTLILAIRGQTHTYVNDKDGRRQAILDGLAATETLTVGDDVYLSVHDSLQVVAAVLYPDGIQTEAAYETVCRVAEKACAHAGFGGEEELGPPVVPFAKRGAYRRRFPPLPTAVVAETLELAGTSGTFPRRDIVCATVWQRAATAVYNTPWRRLLPGQQAQLEAQVDALVAEAGWEKDDGPAAPRYTRPLPADIDGARARLARLLRREAGRPVLYHTVVYQVQLGAYGRGFLSNELGSDLQAMVTETLTAAGYRPTPVDDEYRPLPVVLPPEILAEAEDRLAALAPAATTHGPALLLADVLAALGVAAETISPWQTEQLLAVGPLAAALRRSGYQTETTWCQPYEFRPKRTDGEAQAVILREVRVTQDPERKLSLAQGLAVHTPALVIDDEEETLVYLQMIGAKQAVRANWAALVSGRVNWLGRQRLSLSGMKDHVKVQAALPCGWHDQILIHRQASLQAMNPERPFYLLDDGAGGIPPLFYAMLNKCLALPLLPSWARYLWEQGRREQLITLLNDGRGQGHAAWRVLPAPESWQALVETGLQAGDLRF